jgi:zinc protease
VGILGGAYADFVSPWYAAVGTTIATTMIANTLLTPAMMLYEYVHDACARAAVRGTAGGVLTQAELDEGRNGLLNLRRLSRAQDDVVTGQIANNLFLGRKFAFAQQVDEALAKLTVADINAAWRRYIDPQRLVMAWGGDFKQP